MMRPGLLIALLFVPLCFATGCASTPRDGFVPVPRAEAPVFDPLQFFAGRTEGRGKLDKVFSGTSDIRVESHGEIIRPGVLSLSQIVHEGDKPPRTRTWEIRQVAEGRYEGTLSDATSLVKGIAKGNLLTLRFTMDGGFQVTQHLTLSADGRSAYNEMKVRMMGATVAVLAEEIVRE